MFVTDVTESRGYVGSVHVVMPSLLYV